MSKKSIHTLVDELPKRNLTVLTLKSLDTFLPGTWDNPVGFEHTIRTVTRERNDALIQKIGERAIRLFNDPKQGYQRALWLYQTIDNTGTALGTAALANKVGEKVPMLGFLNRITPQPEKAQALDLSLKLVTEIVAFCSINGIPGDSIGDFLRALRAYGGESLVRMAALVAFDGVIPLGPSFIKAVQTNLEKLTPKDLEENRSFKSIREGLPGRNSREHLNFITESFDSTKDWMGNFVSSKGLTRQKLVSNLHGAIDFADDKADYLGAFLDMSTNYYEHTGIQTLAHRLIERAVAEI